MPGEFPEFPHLDQEISVLEKFEVFVKGTVGWSELGGKWFTIWFVYRLPANMLTRLTNGRRESLSDDTDQPIREKSLCLASDKEKEDDWLSLV